jgi:hypothetical protein
MWLERLISPYIDRVTLVISMPSLAHLNRRLGEKQDWLQDFAFYIYRYDLVKPHQPTDSASLRSVK